MRVLMILFYASFLNTMVAAGSQDKLFPVIENWTRGEVERYSPENLYNAINGGSELYLKFNFMEMVTADYQRGDNYITVELYKHASPIDAFGVYSMERPQEDKYCSIGVQGFREADYIYFLAGQYYIKIRALKADETSLIAMEAIAQKQAECLNNKAVFPTLFSIFPLAEKVEFSEKYISESILGYKFLKHSYEVRYLAEGKEYTLFVLQGDDDADASSMLSDYLEAAKYVYPQKERAYHAVEDRYNGPIGIIKSGRYLFCSRGEINNEKSEKLLMEMLKHCSDTR